MDDLVEFVGLGSLIVLSMMFALSVEWLALRALLRLMPGRAAERRLDQSATQLRQPATPGKRRPIGTPQDSCLTRKIAAART